MRKARCGRNRGASAEALLEPAEVGGGAKEESYPVPTPNPQAFWTVVVLRDSESGAVSQFSSEHHHGRVRYFCDAGVLLD